MGLRKFEEGLASCLNALTIKSNNSEIQILRERCTQELDKVLSNLHEKAVKQGEVEQKWKDAWTIISHTGGGKDAGTVAVGYASANQQPAQLKEVLPHITSNPYMEITHAIWPVIILYPQYGQLDVIEGLDVADMLAMHLAEMFPELADLDSDDVEGDGMAVSWDINKEYQVSRLVVYVQLEATPRIRTLEEWLNSCKEQSALRGELEGEINQSAQIEFKRRNTEHELMLSYCKQNSKKINKSKSGGSKKIDSGNSLAAGVEFDRVGYLDIHLGCTFKDILTAPGHVLPGGLLTLLVFVRDNSAHLKFLENINSNSHGVWSLTPNNNKQNKNDTERLI